MTREEATTMLNNLVEQVNGTPELHRQLWQAIETLNEPLDALTPAEMLARNGATPTPVPVP